LNGFGRGAAKRATMGKYTDGLRREGKPVKKELTRIRQGL